jgi:predicted alpha/beta hydrolase family esterase
VSVLLALPEQLGEGEHGLHTVVAHSFGAAAAVLALEAGLAARGVLLLAPAREPALFIERVRRFLGLPAARAAGMRRRVVELVGRELSFFDAARAATGLRQRCLILHDPADPETPWSGAESIARAWRGSQLTAAEGDGHYQILHSPHTIDRAVGFALSLE